MYKEYQSVMFQTISVLLLLRLINATNVPITFGDSSNAISRSEVIRFGQPLPKPTSDCQTPSQKPGYCIAMTKCKVLFDQLQNSPSAQVIQNLRESICRFEKSTPIICCPIEENSSTEDSRISTSTPETVTEATTAETTIVTDTPKGRDLLPKTCGITKKCLRPRIVSGRPVKEEQDCWDWIAALGFEDARGGLKFLCGGALITDRHIVTAAHCVKGNSDLTTIRLGELILDRDDEKDHKDIRISERIVHEEYNPSTEANDIAILKLAETIEFNETSPIRPVCLPTSDFWVNNTLENFRPIVAGWGSIEYSGASSDHLLEAEVKVVPEPECAAAYSSINMPIGESTLCAGKDGKDACQGDSGGPLIQVDPEGLTTLVGIVSFGFRCAEPGYPGVYSRVTHYLDWIISHLD